MTERPPFSVSCPLPRDSAGERITLAHGEGGRLARELIQQRITCLFAEQQSAGQQQPIQDAAWLAVAGGLPTGSDSSNGSAAVAVTTDSFVVAPLFFPGGDIGSLAIHGTVNDLAVAGAWPRWVTLALILEEGLPMATLDRVLASVATAAKRCGVAVVAGDTKVVPRGAADGMFINTTGIGTAINPVPPGPSAARPGDRVLVSGPLGQHGVAVLSARENLGFEPPPISDSAPLHEITAALQRELGDELRAMRDATRGGLSAVLHEWAEASGRTLRLDEAAIPVSAEVRGICELLGLDPLYVANEGTFAAIVSEQASGRALELLRSFSQSSKAAIVGSVVTRTIAPVAIEGILGGLRPVDEPSGAPLPRIC